MWMMPVGSVGSSRKRSSDAEQSLGTDEEDGGHDGEDDGDRGLRPEQGHQALGHAHEESRRDGPQEIPQPREGAAQSEGSGEEAMDVDAEEGDHLLVLDARAHDRPVARLLEEEPCSEHEERGGDHDEEPVLRVERDAEVDAAAQERWRELAHPHGAPDDDDALRHDQRQAEGEQELVVVPGLVERPDPAVLDEDPEQSHAEGRDHEREPEIAYELDDRIEEIGAEAKRAPWAKLGMLST